MSFDVWFRDDVTRILRALRLAGDASRDMPAYALRDQERAYREGFERGYNAALLAMSAAFGMPAAAGGDDTENKISSR